MKKSIVISIVCILAVLIIAIGVKSLLPVHKEYVEAPYSISSSNAGISTILR